MFVRLNQYELNTLDKLAKDDDSTLGGTELALGAGLMAMGNKMHIDKHKRFDGPGISNNGLYGASSVSNGVANTLKWSGRGAAFLGAANLLKSFF